MAYQVIARKWRPTQFDEVVGQSHISQTLSNALKNQRLPHALLFTGPRGTGKTSSARILAKALRCPQAKDFVPCGKCSDCLDIAEGRSVDVYEIDGASNNGVDAIRELRDSVGYMPSSGKHKVYIIDEVHMLSGSAFNALLKTLEEPPPHIVFVMATTEAHKIPNTILSRCQRFDFRRISTREICNHLQSICKQEKITSDNESLWTIARQADGSMRDSQSLLDQVITYCEGNLSLEKVVQALGLTDRVLITDCLSALISRDSAKTLEIIERLFTSGFDPQIFMRDLLEEIRNLLMIKAAPNNYKKIVDIADSEAEFLGSLTKDLSYEDIHLLFDMALKGANDLSRAQDSRIVLEVLLLRMAVAPRIVDLSQIQYGVVEMTAPMTQRLPESHQPAKPKTETKAVVTPKVSTSEHKWEDLVDKIKNVNTLVAAKLEHSYIQALEDKNIKLAVPAKMKFLYDQINEAGFKKKLSNYIATFWGAGYNLEVVMGKSIESEDAQSPKILEKKRADFEESVIRNQVENHPLVKSVKTTFKSEIRSIKEST